MAVQVEILAYAPSEFYHCTHCEVVWQQAGIGPKIHREQRESALPDDLQQQFQRIAGWAHALYQRFGDQVEVRVVDPASLEGFFKSLRHWAHRYPAYILDGKPMSSGTDMEEFTAAVEKAVATRNVT